MTVINVIKSYEEYNERRYSTPWVCLASNTGDFDFTTKVGKYTASKGQEGDLIVYEPVIGQLYGYGQKDYRGRNSEVNLAVFTDDGFVDVSAKDLKRLDEIIAKHTHSKSFKRSRRTVEVDFSKADETPIKETKAVQADSTDPQSDKKSIKARVKAERQQRKLESKGEARIDMQRDVLNSVIRQIKAEDAEFADALDGAVIEKVATDLVCRVMYGSKAREIYIGKNGGITALGCKPNGTPKLMRAYSDVITHGVIPAKVYLDRGMNT